MRTLGQWLGELAATAPALIGSLAQDPAGAAAPDELFGGQEDVERGVLPATRVDPVVFRSLLRMFHMLDAPETLLRDPYVLLRSLPVLARSLAGDEPADRFVTVSRDDALRRLRAA